MIFLDTNIVSKFMRGRDRLLVQRFDAARQTASSIALSVIVIQELEYGIAKAPFPERTRAKVDVFLSGIDQIVSFDLEDALVLADIRKRLVPAGHMIGPFDAMIAAQALRRGAVLVTNNTSEFHRVPGLRIVDWTRN